MQEARYVPLRPIFFGLSFMDLSLLYKNRSPKRSLCIHKLDFAEVIRQSFFNGINKLLGYYYNGINKLLGNHLMALISH